MVKTLKQKLFLIKNLRGTYLATVYLLAFIRSNVDNFKKEELQFLSYNIIEEIFVSIRKIKEQEFIYT